MKKWFINLSIQKKLTAGFVAVALLSLLASAAGVAGLLLVRKADNRLYEEDVVSLDCAGRTGVTFQQMRYASLKIAYMDASDTAALKTAVDELSGYFAEVGALLDECKSYVTEAEIAAHITELQADWATYVDAMTAENNRRLRGETVAVDPALVTLGTQLREDFLEMFDNISAAAESKARENALVAQIAILAVLILAVANFVCSILIGRTIARLIGQPLVVITKVSEKLAVGDLVIDDVVTEEDYRLMNRNDEIGGLTRAFQNLIEATQGQVDAAQRLSTGDLTAKAAVRSENDRLGKGLVAIATGLTEVVRGIASAAESVSADSTLVSNTSMALSQGATEQASTVEELTASLEEISSQTGLNAQNAEKASSLALTTRTDADAGSSRMKEMLSAMDEIHAASGSIYKIIKVIEDIAFQTNILALNAAVEAARAGQHGRGFAVVAEEVRTLAARSSKAAGETAELIETSIRKTDAGTKIARETAAALTRIVEGVEAVSALVDSIAVASREQALGIEQINQGIVEVSQVAQTNAATAQESTAASEELAGQSERLRRIVGAFRYTDAGAPPAPKAPAAPANPPPAAAPAKTGPRPPVRRAPAKITLSDSEFGKY